MSIVLLTEPFSGGGGGSGTVTSVDVVGGTTGLTTTGGPITTSGTITLDGVLNVANGGTGTSTPGLVAGTNVTITGTWPNQTINSSGGGGGGSGTVTSVSVVSANGLAGTVANPTTTPAITLSTSVTGLLKGNGTSISAASSGTDYAPATSGTSILYGNGTGGFSNVTIGSGLSFSTGTLSATGSGTVTSVTGTSPVVSSGGSTPDISLAAAYGDTLNPYASKTANYVLAAPNGSAGAPTFRALVAADIPALSYQAPITLTTTGTSGAATFIGNTLNIPQYSGGGGGGSPNLDGGTPTSNYGGITAINGGTP